MSLFSGRAFHLHTVQTQARWFQTLMDKDETNCIGVNCKQGTRRFLY